MAHAWWRDSDYELFYRLTKERDAALARERKLREALRGLLSRPFAKPGWSPEWDALMNAASAALAEEGP